MPIQSITVTAPTPIFIPSNAKVLAVSYTGSASASSPDDCADLDVDPLECGIFIFGGNAVEGGEHPYLTETQTFVTGIKFDGVDYTFPSQVGMNDNGVYSLSDIITQISITPTVKDIIFNPSFDFNSDSGDDGASNYICFQTIPGGISKLFLKQVSGQASFYAAIEYYTPAVPRADVEGDGYSFLCNCPATVPI